MTASETLADFIESIALDRLPAALVTKAKDHLLDTIGVTCAGLSEPQSHALLGVVKRWGGIAEAGVVGTKLRLPAPKAAFLNALHGRLHTFDDTHEAGPAHPGSTVVASALAAAEAQNASGRTLLESLLAGYETATRVAAALGATHYTSGFQNTGTSAPFGAAAAAAKARGLTAAETAAAFGLAGEAAIGLRQYQHDGSMLDTALNGARGAELGVAAADMASAGLGGPRGILDGQWGVLRVMAGGTADQLTDGLGAHWEFSHTAMKPFASCRFTHGPVAVLRDARIDHRSVQTVDISTFRQSIEVSDRPDPQNRAEAVLSHQIAAAMALLGKSMLPRDYDVLDDEVVKLAGRVRVKHDPALDHEYPAHWPHRIVVTLRDGTNLGLDTAHPPHADATLVVAKFRALAGPVLGVQTAETIIALVQQLETLTDLRPLFGLLYANSAEAR
jgi:2-methylcitrate dehydratase PrpD